MRQDRARLHIYLSSNFWDGLWVIQQPISQEIGRTEPVLYVEQPVSLFTVLRRPGYWRRLFAWARGLRRVQDNVHVLAPLPLFHLGHRFPRLYALELRLQRRWIERWAATFGDRPRVLWMDNPVYGSLAGHMREEQTVYHVGDDIAAFDSSHGPTMRRLEQSLLSRADVVFAAAQHLADARRPLNARTYAITNAIDPSSFAAEPSAATIAEIEASAAPRVALVGMMDSWVDVDLLAYAARALPDVSFVIVGPWRVDDAPVRALPNVSLLGRRDRREIAGILRRTSASLVPFRKTTLTERIMPVKIYEALAAGVMPIASDFSTEVAALARTGRVWVGHSPDEFVALIRRAVAEDTPVRRRELSEFGLRQTWAARWEEMDAILREATEDAPAERVREAAHAL